MKNFAANISTIFAHLLKASTLAMTDYSSPTFRPESRNLSSSNSTFQFKNFKRFFKNSPYFPFVIVGIFVIVIVGVLINAVVNKQNSTLGATTSNKQVNIAKPIAQETLNKNFDFPLKDATGKVVSKIHYTIVSAELDNQIIIKGQQATAVAGRSFLVLNLKITNSYDKDVQLNTKDYVRLIVDNSSDKLAADIHNDPVDVQAIATKFTRIGFPIDTTAKNLVLQVGEIDGPKQTIQLDLKYQ